MQSIMLFLVMTILGTVLLYPSVLGIHLKAFPFESENNHYDNDYALGEIENNTLNSLNESSSNNASEYRTDEKLLESASNMRASENFRTEDSNITFTSSSIPLSINASNTQSSQAEITLTEIFTNESNSTSSVPHTSGHPSSSTGQTKSSTKSTSLGVTNEEIIVSSTEDEEEGVVRGKPSSTESTNITTTTYESIYQKALSLINDTYTLSILLPVAAGIVFASTILITITTCKCLRRQCRRRRLRRKTLPDSVKNFRPSDRARLLAESSEEEF